MESIVSLQPLRISNSPNSHLISSSSSANLCVRFEDWDVAVDGDAIWWFDRLEVI